jgi:hypothetical protein
MALVADSNFTNNLVSVSAFSPFPTGGGNKVLQMDTSGVLLSNDVDLANVGDVDITMQCLVLSTPSLGSNGSFGFILNRDAAGKFYYLLASPQSGSSSMFFYIYRYSGGVGGSFTLIAHPTNLTGIASNTIFDLTARVRSSTRGPNLALLFNGEVRVSTIDTNASQINSGQVGIAANIIGGDGTNFTRYVDNWFARTV